MKKIRLEDVKEKEKKLKRTVKGWYYRNRFAIGYATGAAVYAASLYGYSKIYDKIHEPVASGFLAIAGEGEGLEKGMAGGVTYIEDRLGHRIGTTVQMPIEQWKKATEWMEEEDNKRK